MHVILKRLASGAVLWLVPYAAAMPLLGLQQSDVALFKTIMVVIGSIVGAALAAHHFMSVEKDFVKEGLLLALTWITLNWVLDFVALLPFTKQSVPRYFAEIGLRYFAMVAPTVAIGVVLAQRSPSSVAARPKS